MQYMHKLMWVVIFAFFVIFGFAGLVEKKSFVDGFVTLAATLTGAALVWLWQSEDKEIDRLCNERAAINRALFILARQLMVVHNVKEVFKGFECIESMTFGMPSQRLISYDELVQKFADLEFMLSGDPGLIMNLAVADEQFHQMLDVIVTRSEHHSGPLKNAWHDAGLNSRDAYSVDELSAALGIDLYNLSLKYTRQMLEFVNVFAATAENLQSQLREYAKRKYPSHVFLHVRL